MTRILSLTLFAASSLVVPAAGDDVTEDRGLIDEIERRAEQVRRGQGDGEYDPAGRRDPFIDPTSAPTAEELPRPDGLAGMRVGEVRLTGLSVHGSEPIALLLGSDRIGYTVRAGDALWDGHVDRIEFDAGTIVFAERVQERDSPTRYREVRRELP